MSSDVDIIAAARRAAFLAPAVPIAKVPTGIPAGICAIDKRLSNPFNVLLSTAISHLIGIPNLDSMSGKFYARFSVKNEDNSDSYLRQAHRRMELHNDGTYVEETTDWVIMQKILEVDVEGGDSLLLHIDDWQDLDKFYHHPLAKVNLQWGSPSSKNITYKTCLL